MLRIAGQTTQTKRSDGGGGGGDGMVAPRSRKDKMRNPKSGTV